MHWSFCRRMLQKKCHFEVVFTVKLDRDPASTDIQPINHLPNSLFASLYQPPCRILLTLRAKNPLNIYKLELPDLDKPCIAEIFPLYS